MIDFRYRVRTSAFHEAGHSFAAVHYGIPFSKVWILKRTDLEDRSGETLGQLTRALPVNKPDYFGKLNEAKAEATLAFCGPFAECLAYPELQDPDLVGSNRMDSNEARSMLRFAITPCRPTASNPFTPEDLQSTAAEVNQLLQECAGAAVQLVRNNPAAIRRIEEALLELWELPEDEVIRLCRDDGAQAG